MSSRPGSQATRIGSGSARPLAHAATAKATGDTRRRRLRGSVGRTCAGRRRDPRSVPCGHHPRGRRTTEAGPPACARSIASLASWSATVLRARGTCAADQRSNPARVLPSRRPERDQLGVLDPPAAGQLLDDQLRIEQQMDLARTELARQIERPDDARVLGDVVGLDAEVVGDRGVRDRAVVAGVRSCQVEQRRPERGRAGVAACRAVGPDDEPAAPARRSIRPSRAHLPARGRTGRSTGDPIVGGIGWPSVSGRFRGARCPPCSTGSSTCGAGLGIRAADLAPGTTGSGRRTRRRPAP